MFLNPLREITVEHFGHSHTGADELQLITACNDAYAKQRRAEWRNANRSTIRARRAAVRRSRRANRRAA